MWTWVKNLFNAMLNVFKAFIQEAISQSTAVVIAELRTFAISTITTLATTDLTSEEKRKQAFEEIKAEAIARGKSIGDSEINLLIELAVQYLKNKS